VTVPGLSLGPSVERRSRRRREFSQSKSLPRAPSRSPSRSPSWQTRHRRPGRRWSGSYSLRGQGWILIFLHKCKDFFYSLRAGSIILLSSF
jgi:hypothetical protein